MTTKHSVCLWFGCQGPASEAIRVHYPSTYDIVTEAFCEEHIDAAVAEVEDDANVGLVEASDQ